MSAPGTRIIVDAVVATALLSEQIIVGLHAKRAASRKETHACLDRAIAHARELVTRLEVAQQLYAATPLEREPVDSAQWTGRA